MPSGDATLMKILSPLHKGDFKGVLERERNPSWRSATAIAAHHPSDGGDLLRPSHLSYGF